MQSVNHINWPYFPLLAARIKQIEVGLAQGCALPLIYGEDESSQILHGIETSIAAINIASCEAPPILDNFLEKIHAVFISNHARLGLSQNSLALISSVDKFFLSKPCLKCGAQHKCNQSSVLSNATAVHEFGECFRLVRELFDFVVELCYKFYVMYAELSSGVKLELNTSRLSSRNTILNLAITADTRDEPDFERSINLYIVVSEFGLDEYFACLYIMFHECFVHGWCGLSIQSGEANYSDSFHEGWMDWVGFELLSEWLRADSAILLGKFREHTSEFLDAGIKVRSRRFDYLKPLHRNAARHASAAMAARSLLVYFEMVLEDRERARAAFFHFSLALNASVIEDEQRALLVINVLEHLSGRAATKTFINNAALSKAIEDFERDRSVKALVCVLNSL